MKLKPLILVPAAVTALALAGCSSDDSASSDPTAAPTTALQISACPTAGAAASAKPDWTLKGATGSLQVVAPTDEHGPGIIVEQPFTVAETTVKTLTEGDGAVVSAESMVDVCYTGLNGRDGKVFDSSYDRGQSAQFSPGGVVPGFGKALIGQKVGSTVAVAMTSEDGYAQGNPDAGIEVGDTIVFALKINAAQELAGS